MRRRRHQVPPTWTSGSNDTVEPLRRRRYPGEQRGRREARRTRRSCPRKPGARPSSSTSSRRCASRGWPPTGCSARGGVIINISSIYGRESGGPLTYNSSKAAMISFTQDARARDGAEERAHQFDRARIDSAIPAEAGSAASRRIPPSRKISFRMRRRPAASGVRKKSPTRS